MAIANYFQWIISIALVTSTYSYGYRREGSRELFIHHHGQETSVDDVNPSFHHDHRQYSHGHDSSEDDGDYRQHSYGPEDDGNPPFHHDHGDHNHRPRKPSDKTEGVNARSIHEDTEHNDDLEQARNLNTASRVRADNGTFKIINISPASQQNQRDSKDDEDSVSRVRDGGIVFPGPAGKSGTTKNFTPVVTDDCKEGQTLCNAILNYPEDYIEGLLSNSADDLRHQFSVDELEPIKIAQRIGDVDDFELCQYKERIAFPKAAQNKDNKWSTIINHGQYVQGFRVEICKSESSSCSPAATFRLGLEATCRQKYVLRKMTAVNADGQVIMDHFRLPSCCSCVVRSVDTFSRRRRSATAREP